MDTHTKWEDDRAYRAEFNRVERQLTHELRQRDLEITQLRRDMIEAVTAARKAADGDYWRVMELIMFITVVGNACFIILIVIATRR